MVCLAKFNYCLINVLSCYNICLIVLSCYNNCLIATIVKLPSQLLQELDGHPGFINSLCFNEDNTIMYSGDNVGRIRAWSVFVTPEPSSKGRSFQTKPDITP